MSIAAQREIVRWSGAKGGARLVMLGIADYADSDGFCWPSLSALEEYTRLGRRQIMRIVEELERAAELFVVREVGRQNYYFIAVGSFREGLADAVRRRLKVSRDEADKLIQGWLSGVKMSPVEDVERREKRVENRCQKVTGEIMSPVTNPAKTSDMDVTGVVTSMSPEPLLTTKNHHHAKRNATESRSDASRRKTRAEVFNAVRHLQARWKGCDLGPVGEAEPKRWCAVVGVVLRERELETVLEAIEAHADEVHGGGGSVTGGTLWGWLGKQLGGGDGGRKQALPMVAKRMDTG